MRDALTLLEEHHRDGPQFMQLMKDTATNRFDGSFWATWETWIIPILSKVPQIADFGCGPGMLLKSLREHYPEARLIGIEYAPWMLEVLEKDLYKVIEHDLHKPNLPIADNSLDAITNIICIHEMSQPIRLLQSIYRCLKPKGRCLISDWVRAPLNDYIAAWGDFTPEANSNNIFDEQIGHDILSDIFTHFMEHNRYTRKDIVWMLRSVGFSILEDSPLQEGRFRQWILEKKVN
jgi:ubiquinone/menaquinone biosynthesis C-methylase UbiE